LQIANALPNRDTQGLDVEIIIDGWNRRAPKYLRRAACQQQEESKKKTIWLEAPRHLRHTHQR
jgi:hypothetical protein